MFLLLWRLNCICDIKINTISENIALHKPTYQQHPYRGSIERELVNSSNAVDGLRSDLSFKGGQCVLSDNEKQTATWWVNLTSILSIHHITIYYRTGNLPWGMVFMSTFIKKTLQCMCCTALTLTLKQNWGMKQVFIKASHLHRQIYFLIKFRFLQAILQFCGWMFLS